MDIVTTERLTKRYGDKKVVNEVSLHVAEGEIYGFLGLNGAGKTTTIRMLLGMIKASSGNINLFGKPVGADSNTWRDVGYMVETPAAYPELTVYENLLVFARLRGIKSRKTIEQTMERLKIAQYEEVKAKHLSLGNKQRLGLAKAIMHDPQLLILDEPVNGLDPAGIVEIRKLLEELAGQGKTIFLSSHILEEISKIAHRIGIIHEGRLIKELNKAELESSIEQKYLLDTTDNIKALALLQALSYEPVMNGRGRIEISAPEVFQKPELISKLLVQHDVPAKEMVHYREDLETFFLRTISTKENDNNYPVGTAEA